MVMSAAKTVDEYLAELPPGRRAIVAAIRDVVTTNLPEGYEEAMGFGMISYNVPKSVLAETYNGLPLCYAAIAAQKNHTAVYLTCANADTPIGKRLRDEFAAEGKKLDMGKSCVRFKALDDISLGAIGHAVAAMPVDQYVAIYEKSRLDTKAGAKKAAAKSRSRTKPGARH